MRATRMVETIASRHGDRQIVRIHRGDLLRVKRHEGLHRFIGRWGDYVKFPTMAVLPRDVIAPCNACLIRKLHAEPVPASCVGCDAMPDWVEDRFDG